MATATQLVYDMDLLRGELTDLRKATPTTGQVHHNRPLGNKDKDGPGTQEVDPPDQTAIEDMPEDEIVPGVPIVKVISGSSDISLNAEGMKLANRLAERIAAKGCLDVLYSSTLPRGIETVRPILEACAHCVYAEASGALVPWKLGEYEGREPSDVGAQIAALIDSPNDVPPGSGSDGLPGESFNAAKARQLGFFKRIMQDWIVDPALKIGVQLHSRGEDLFIAWVEAGAPIGYDVDAKELTDPDERPHASVVRWAGKYSVEDVDLDSDAALKGGVYLILHSLTNDDGDSGEPGLSKADTRILWHGTSAEDFDAFADRPTYLTDDRDHAMMFATDPTAGGGAGAGEPRALRVACKPGTSKDITSWTRPEFDKGVDGDVDGVVERMGAQALAEGHSYVEFDHPSAHHDAEGTFRSVVSLMPTRDLTIQKYSPDQPRADNGEFGSGGSLYHGTTEENGKLILAQGLRVSKSEMLDGSVYAAVSKDDAIAYGNGHATEKGEKTFSVVVIDKSHFGLDAFKEVGMSYKDVPPSAVRGIEFYNIGEHTPYKVVSNKSDAADVVYVCVTQRAHVTKYDDTQQRDDHGRFGSGQVALGSAQIEHDRLKDHPAREQHASETAHNAFARDVDKFGDRVGRLVQQNTSALMSARMTGGTSALKAAKGQMESGREMLNESARMSGDERMWRVDTALSSFHSALLLTSKVLGSKWVGKRADEIMQKRVYMPPIEVHRAAKSAWDAGMSVIGITDGLAQSLGLDYDAVQCIANFFAASESATMSTGQRNAYGGVNAAKWASKVIAKSARAWEPWVGVDLDGTLAMPTQSYDGTAIGAPIKAMVEKVKAMLAKGVKVRIFTARVADDPDGKVEAAVKAYCLKNIGQELPVTNEKDPGMVELWDDRAHNPTDIAKAGSGVMIAFMLDAATADRLKVEDGEDPADMHVTLAYLGKLDKIDMAALPALEQAIKAYAARHAPVTGTIDGPVRFSAKPQTGGRDVVVAAFCNPGIQEFRAGLVDAVEAAGVDVPRVFDYRPHICIKYIPVDAPMPVQRIAPMSVTFGSVTLCVGGARKSYPLSGDVVKYDPAQQRDDRGRFGVGAFDKAVVLGGTYHGESKLDLPVREGVRASNANGFGDCTTQTLMENKANGSDVYVGVAVRSDRYNAAKSAYDKDGTHLSTEAIPHAWNVRGGEIVDRTFGSADAKDYVYFGQKVPNSSLSSIHDGDELARYHVSLPIYKYSPDQPRAADGEFGSGGGTRAKGNARVERARKSCVLIKAKEQKVADKAEQKLSDALGVPRTRNNSAFDLRNDDVGVEVKTLLVGANEKITMNKTALARKVAEQRDDDLRGYTVVADMRGGRERAAYYYKEGFGSFRLGSMTKVSLSELKGIIR